MRNYGWVLFLIEFAVFVFTPSSVLSKKEPAKPVIEVTERRMPGGAEMIIFRIDPKRARFSCAYSNPPKRVKEFAKNAGAALTVNGGYWGKDYTPTDLLIVNGDTIKKANLKNSHYGLFYVKKGRAWIRDLRIQPVGAKERFEYALKSGPTLIKPGGKPYYLKKSVSAHARNAIGADKEGRIFFVLNKTGRITYKDLTDILHSKEIQADYAFNLDGGSSVGYYLRLPKQQVLQRRSAPVSSVIQVFLNE